MAIVQLPNHCGHKSIIVALAEAGLLAEPPDKIAIHFPDSSFVYPSAIGFLAAWGLYQRQQRGTRLIITGDDNSRRYLSRMDLMAAALESPSIEDFQRDTQPKASEGLMGRKPRGRWFTESPRVRKQDTGVRNGMWHSRPDPEFWFSNQRAPGRERGRRKSLPVWRINDEGREVGSRPPA